MGYTTCLTRDGLMIHRSGGNAASRVNIFLLLQLPFLFLFIERLLFSFRHSFCLSFVVHLSLVLNGREMQGLGVIVLQRKAQPG